MIVNDIVNTGHSVRRTAEAVRAAGGYAHGRKWVSLHGQPNRR